MNISEIKQGQNCRIVEICGGQEVFNKLDSLGVRIGACVQKVSSQFFKGPVTIKAGNTQIAVGYRMAKKIIVECLK